MLCFTKLTVYDAGLRKEYISGIISGFTKSIELEELECWVEEKRIYQRYYKPKKEMYEEKVKKEMI